MTSSHDPDAPQAPGSPMRQDAAEGGFSPDGERDHLREAEPEHGSDDAKDIPPVSHEPEQSGAEAAEQEENAETSMDQPSQ